MSRLSSHYTFLGQRLLVSFEIWEALEQDDDHRDSVIKREEEDSDHYPSEVKEDI